MVGTQPVLFPPLFSYICDKAQTSKIKTWAISLQSSADDISELSDNYRKIRISEKNLDWLYPHFLFQKNHTILFPVLSIFWVILLHFGGKFDACRHGCLATHHGCLIFLLRPSTISHEEALIRAVARWWGLYIPSSSCYLCRVSGGVLTPGSIFTCDGFTFLSDLIHRKGLSRKWHLGDCY